MNNVAQVERVTMAQAVMILRNRAVAKFKEAAKAPDFKAKYVATKCLVEAKEPIYEDLLKSSPSRWSLPYCLVLDSAMGLGLLEAERKLYQAYMQAMTDEGVPSTVLMVDKPDEQ